MTINRLFIALCRFKLVPVDSQIRVQLTLSQALGYADRLPTYVLLGQEGYHYNKLNENEKIKDE